jgi:hypothetical protein
VRLVLGVGDGWGRYELASRRIVFKGGADSGSYLSRPPVDLPVREPAQADPEQPER